MSIPNFIKIAAQTYSYSAAKSRNFTPPNPTIKPKMVKLDAAQELRAKELKPSPTDAPARSGNKPWNPNGYATWKFTHPFTPTISGTGNGHQYWRQPQNPYET